MKTWILYRLNGNQISSEFYEVNRLREVGSARGFDLEVISPEQVELIVTRDDPKSIRVDGSVVTLPDVLLPRMGAGTTYFALSVIRQLERFGVPTYNASTAIETVKDKLHTHQVLSAAKLPIPRTMLAKFPIDLDLVGSVLNFPLVVKTLSGSQGSGVFLCESRSNFRDLMELIQATQANANFIFQEFVAASHGSDIRVLVIGGRVVAAMERTSQGDDFKANFSQGGTVREFAIDREAEWLALESARLLGLDIAGIDLLKDEDGYKICEANSSPGFEGIESCCDVDVASEIFQFIVLRLHGTRSKPQITLPKSAPGLLKSEE